ncbi:hypothetical protein SAMN04488003_101250 [Loktanella fryxellensis]|uniref:Uncharacterized protein n=1 Tax=Loktanella fryxellensis TaxID=245187 RepID=A0A1H7YPC2_9RHOB|nr:hypothetical protein [Loktanella fryxellensis]SEM47815.1 hypothetical protein SAMN04488003_101250 [Loktanella fryxellensis]
MAPETTVVLIVIAFVVFAYVFAYPILRVRTASRLAAYDAVLTLAQIGVVGALFWGSGVRFDALLFETNWFWFALILSLLIEGPVAYWYKRRHNISLSVDLPLKQRKD